MKKVLVLGGAGFIGQNISRALLLRGDAEVTIADNMFRGKRDTSLNELLQMNSCKLIEADFTRSESFELLDSSYDYVYMMASVVGVHYTSEIPDELVRINTSLILNTLEWLKKARCKKVLFASTSECYSGIVERAGGCIPTSEEIAVGVTDVLNPRFTYAITKMLGETGFYQYSKVHNFECVIVRYHNVYGPRMGFKHVIPQVVQRMLNNEKNFKIFGFDQTRAFNYITDAVSATVLAMESGLTNGEIIHVGDMRAEIRIDTLVGYIAKLLNFEGTFRNVEAPPGSVYRRCPDTAKAEKLLNYTPKTDWKSGVKFTVEWYVEYINSGGNIYE